MIRETTTKEEESLKKNLVVRMQNTSIGFASQFTILSLWLVWETHIIVVGKLQMGRVFLSFHSDKVSLVPYFHLHFRTLQVATNLALPVYRICESVTMPISALWLWSNLLLPILFNYYYRFFSIHMKKRRRWKSLLIPSWSMTD